MEFEADTTTNIENLTFHITSHFAPEQYDVYKGGRVVGYVRLRGGRFRVDCPGVGGEVVYAHQFESWIGAFDTEEDRLHYLTEAAKAIKQWQQKNKTHK